MPPLPSFWTPAHAQALQRLAREAGACALGHRAAATERASHKADGSPVTEADREAQAIIVAGLRTLTPGIPVVAEEKDNPAELTALGTWWLVDPLDGTRDYVSGKNEFSVNIALMVGGEPCLGVIYAPVFNDLFYGDPTGAQRITATATQPLPPSAPLTQAPRLITSYREKRLLPIENWLRDGLISGWRPCSSAYKYGLVAAGDFDLYLRTGITYEWDTAAGDAILRALGGQILIPDGTPLRYAKPDYLNGNFAAFTRGCDRERVEMFLEALRRV